jgi:hypothetical protein
MQDAAANRSGIVAGGETDRTAKESETRKQAQSPGVTVCCKSPVLSQRVATALQQVRRAACFAVKGIMWVHEGVRRRQDAQSIYSFWVRLCLDKHASDGIKLRIS